MAVKKLVVGTIYATDSFDQQKWLDLQLKCLKATTNDFDHVAVLSEGLTNDSFEKKTKVIVPEDTTLCASDAHVNGLNILLEYFREHSSEYENFLFLDGDAFPIKKDWLNSMLFKMEPQQKFDNAGVAMTKKTGAYYEVAVALRSENLETRLHASITFAKKEALPYLGFKLGLAGDDLLKRNEVDVHLTEYQFSRRHLAFPLIRSNQYNVHPLACGIYFDVFYHHSCGSGRRFNLRAKEYYDRIVQPTDNIDLFTNQLFGDSAKFIGKLAGWSPKRYITQEDMKDGQEIC